jgi:hypothetical protein
MSGLWFRIYDEALDDPRLQRLPASLFRAWFNVLCAASRNGGTLPDLSELAFMLRTRPGALSRRLEALKAAGLIEEIDDGALRPVDWERRQFVERPADPTAAERMRRFRERATERNETVTPPVTNAPIEEDEGLEQDSLAAPAAREGALDAFEEFLSVFPRRDDETPRAPALAAWRKAIAAGAGPARIVAGAKAYAASVAGRERRFVVSAARWLSEERWPQAAPAPAANAAHVETVWISATSPEWRAWAERWRASKGKSPPTDAKGGWRFPLQYRPAPLEQAA